MAYNDSIPQPTDILQQSQADLLANFQALKQLIDVNHSTFGSATEGKHAQVAMPNLGVTPTFSGTDGVFYTNTTSLAGGTSVFVKRPSPGMPIPITVFGGAAEGWSYLPSGILLKWGRGNGSGPVTTVFPVGATIPNLTTAYNAIITVDGVGAGDIDIAVRVSNLTNTQIEVYCSKRTEFGAAAASFRYLIIGI